MPAQKRTVFVVSDGTGITAEMLGLAPRGQGHTLWADGKAGPGGSGIPINTNGGQLSSGRMHGWGYLPEVCLQLWGDGGARQVPNGPEVGVVASGGGVFAGAMLVTRS